MSFLLARCSFFFRKAKGRGGETHQRRASACLGYALLTCKTRICAAAEAEHSGASQHFVASLHQRAPTYSRSLFCCLVDLTKWGSLWKAHGTAALPVAHLAFFFVLCLHFSFLFTRKWAYVSRSRDAEIKTGQKKRTATTIIERTTLKFESPFISKLESKII